MEAQSSSSNRSDFHSKMKRLKISPDLPFYSDSDHSTPKNINSFSFYSNKYQYIQNLGNCPNEDMTDDQTY